MKIRIRIGVGIALASLFCVGVLAQEVNHDWDKNYDFTKVKTFGIKIGTSWNNQLSENRVLAAVAQSLSTKGWTRSMNLDTADSTVVLHGATDVKHTINTFYDGWGGWGYGGYGGAMTMGSGTTTVSDYKVGTLVVDIFDTKSKNLIFRGTASDELNDNPDKNVKKLDKALEKLFKDFPPGSKVKK